MPLGDPIVFPDSWTDCRKASHDFVASHFVSLDTDIDIQLLSPNAKIPTQAKVGDAGYDLYAAESTWIKPGQRALIKTDIALAIPSGYYGRIAPRSGLALKVGIDVLGGVIDAGYRSNVGVILLNTSDGGEEQSFQVRVGDRIAQLIIEKCHSINFRIVESLSTTERAAGGFGSSGS